jgi:hypothetical protein
MNKRSKLAALIGAGLLTFGVAGIALADGTVNWDGSQGLTNGEPTNTQCDANNPAGTVTWVFTLGGSNSVTSATLTISGSGAGAAAGSYPSTPTGNEIKFQTPIPDDFSTTSASVAYVGDTGSGEVNLTISHWCPAEVQPTPTEEAPTPTPGGGGQGESDVPTQPSTDSVLGTGSSSPADSAWLLVVGLGVLLASIVVLTPARAKSRR